MAKMLMFIIPNLTVESTLDFSPTTTDNIQFTDFSRGAIVSLQDTQTGLE